MINKIVIFSVILLFLTSCKPKNTETVRKNRESTDPTAQCRQSANLALADVPLNEAPPLVDMAAIADHMRENQDIGASIIDNKLTFFGVEASDRLLVKICESKPAINSNTVKCIKIPEVKDLIGDHVGFIPVLNNGNEQLPELGGLTAPLVVTVRACLAREFTTQPNYPKPFLCHPTFDPVVITPKEPSDSLFNNDKYLLSVAFMRNAGWLKSEARLADNSLSGGKMLGLSGGETNSLSEGKMLGLSGGETNSLSGGEKFMITASKNIDRMPINEVSNFMETEYLTLADPSIYTSDNTSNRFTLASNSSDCGDLITSASSNNYSNYGDGNGRYEFDESIFLTEPEDDGDNNNEPPDTNSGGGDGFGDEGEGGDEGEEIAGEEGESVSTGNKTLGGIFGAMAALAVFNGGRKGVDAWKGFQHSRKNPGLIEDVIEANTRLDTFADMDATRHEAWKAFENIKKNFTDLSPLSRKFTLEDIRTIATTPEFDEGARSDILGKIDTSLKNARNALGALEHNGVEILGEPGRSEYDDLNARVDSLEEAKKGLEYAANPNKTKPEWFDDPKKFEGGLDIDLKVDAEEFTKIELRNLKVSDIDKLKPPAVVGRRTIEFNSARKDFNVKYGKFTEALNSLKDILVAVKGKEVDNNTRTELNEDFEKVKALDEPTWGKFGKELINDFDAKYEKFAKNLDFDTDLEDVRSQKPVYRYDDGRISPFIKNKETIDLEKKQIKLKNKTGFPEKFSVNGTSWRKPWKVRPHNVRVMKKASWGAAALVAAGFAAWGAHTALSLTESAQPSQNAIERFREALNHAGRQANKIHAVKQGLESIDMYNDLRKSN